jgi:hypothetical protein
MTANGNVTQYNSTPSRCCQTNTDSPNEAPNDNATVPTMTSAATRLRVMNNDEAERCDRCDDQVVVHHLLNVPVGGRRQRRALDSRLIVTSSHAVDRDGIPSLVDNPMRFLGGTGPDVMFVPCGAADAIEVGDDQIDARPPHRKLTSNYSLFW